MLAFKESECVLHSGHGGIGRRYAGCAGVSIKHRVLRSRACRLVLARQSNCEMYFEFEQARIKLSAASSLTIKGLSNEPSRVELVNEDGQHMWLWGVDPQKLPVIVQAFQRMQMEATRQTQPHAKPFLQPQVPDISKEEWQGLTRSSPSSPSSRRPSRPPSLRALRLWPPCTHTHTHTRSVPETFPQYRCPI